MHVFFRIDMRLQPNEVNAIAQAAREAFTPGTAVFLFGSRVDDSKRGGDIDLLVEIPEAMPLRSWCAVAPVLCRAFTGCLMNSALTSLLPRKNSKIRGR